MAKKSKLKGKRFAKGEMFAWGSSLYEARGKRGCEVWPAAIAGKAREMLEFPLDFDPELAAKMLDAIGADTSMLLIGSDCGIDFDSPEYDNHEGSAGE